MADNRFFFYDHDACTFVEVEPSRKGLWLKAGAVLCLSLVLSAVGVGVLSSVMTSPAEVAQAEEIDALRGQLASAHSQLTGFSEELEELAETDREIYRTVLNAEPISEDEFQLGVGGASDDRFARYSTPTAELLTETAETFDRLERQLELQSRSYDEIRSLATDRDAVLRQQPAILPLKGARLTSGFGMRFHPILRVSRMHAGVDFPTPVGTPLYAAGDGTVSFVGTKGGYGNVIEVDHPLAGKVTRYAHLSRVADGVRVGSAVQRGQTVAYSGNTGLSTAPHLHYEVRLLNEARTPINPVATFVPDVTPAQYRELLEAARSQTISFD
ncbi:M23 family metallopeptidase [Rubrivirga sp. IMCC45206]|uniref:M23 family metallopeptidase n=1 Tax=Rubrivirga sp. IMCC45206 TaxID=3391614 RepID=UPI00398F99BD